MLAFKSFNVSNSLTSLANSSSTVGNSFTLISCNLTLNVASFPANSLEKYSSGNLTLMSFSSLTFIPITWSSNPGINVLLPISNSCFSAFPPSKAFPSTNPSKSITAISLFFTALSSTVTSLAFFSAIWSSSFLTSAAITETSAFSNSIPLYFPNLTSGFVWTTAVNIKSLPFSIWVISISGLLTASIPFSFNSFSYISGTISLNVSS